MFDQPLNPQDELKRIIAGLRPPAPPAPQPDAAGGIVNTAAPAAAKVAPIATPNQPVPVIPPQRQTDTNELNRLKNTGAGVEQLQHKHPIVGTIARIGDVALQSMFPTIAPNVPGTEAHHQQLINREQARVNQDLAGEKEQAQTAEAEAQTGEATARGNLANAQASELGQPKPKEENWAEFAGYTDNDGTPLIREQNSGQVVRASDKKPPIGFKATALQKPEKPDTIEQQYQDAIESGDHDKAARLLKVMEDVAKAKQAPQRPPQVSLIIPGPNGTQTLETVRPGQQVPTGAVTPTQFGPEQQKTQQAQRVADSTINSFTRYQNSFHQLSPKLTPDDRQAMQVLSSHQDKIAGGLIESSQTGILDSLLGQPLTGYSEKLMNGAMTKDQYDKMSPEGKKMLADYFHAILANFINMKQRMGTAGSRNQAMIQAEMNAIPLPYIDQQSADQMFNDTIEDIRTSSGAPQPAPSSRRVIDLTTR